MKSRYMLIDVIIVLLLGTSFIGCSRVNDSTYATGASKKVASKTVNKSGNENIGKITIGDGKGDASVEVHSHSYNVVTTWDELKALENTITYVLLPKNLSGHSNKNTAIYKRYVQVLELIQELKMVDKSMDPHALKRKKENEFILFKKMNVASPVTVENYNYELSFKVLDFFQEKYPNALFKKDGPYLITTAKNVLNGEEAFSFLYINLSSFNNSSVKEVIESYKQRLINKGNSDVNILEAWRYTLLLALTNLNADIHIFQAAVAGDL